MVFTVPELSYALIIRRRSARRIIHLKRIWFSYIISTVLDDDMNGLIKIKEVNEFTSAMPPGITLLQWTVYCASGQSICAILRTPH